jgi:phospholipid/cholesterol/gamma-HCH transport system substrate-binding protein
MRNEKSSNIKLGLFITVAFALFTATVYYIGTKQNLFGATFQVSSFFQNVNGLQVGNNVRYSGIDIGNVDEITIINDSTVRVNMQLQKEVQKFLKKDAIASIGTDGLVGNMLVNINPGVGLMPHVTDYDTIQSYTRIEAGDMMNTLGKTTENIALLTLNLMEIAENINRGKGSLPMLINDPTMANDLKLTVKNLRKTSELINTLGGELETSMELINQGKGLLGYLLRDTTFENQIKTITQGLDTLIRNRTSPIINNLEQSTTDIAKSSAELKELIQELDLNEGLAYTIFKDSLISKDLEQTMYNLNQGTERFNETMEALQHNFLVRGFFKKKEKEQQKNLKKKKP